jgi:uncharacterized protein (TIGR02996 family)
MDDDISFLNAIFSQPHDDALRLVYADWLEERGDPRAAYVRLYMEVQASGKRIEGAQLREMNRLEIKLDSRWTWWFSEARTFPAGFRLELLVVAAGKSLIDMRGGLFETALLVEGRPIALNWDDCRGSVGQYLVFTGHTCYSSHHKLAAHNREYVKPTVLNVARWQAPGIKLEEGVQWLPSRHRGIAEYCRMKRETAR